MGHDADKRADIYAMGVLTFEMLTGRLPFIGSNRMEVAYSTVNAPIPSAVKLNAALPDEIDLLLAKILAKDPAQRPQTVRDLLSQMARLPQRRSQAPAAVVASPGGGVAIAPQIRAGVAIEPATAANMRSMAAGAPAAPAPPPHALHGSPIPTPTGVGGPAIRTPELVGVRAARARGRLILNSHVSNLGHVARDVTAYRWPE